jgi:ribonuclease P protein component
VDDSAAGVALDIPAHVIPLPGRWLGMVCPKRHARRAVTRNLLKRQMRALMDEHGGALPLGLWVMRLRAPFDPRQFPSATSDALRIAARTELRGLIDRAAGGGAVPAAPAR